MGEVLSAMASNGLTAPARGNGVDEAEAVYGLRPLRSRGGIVTNEMIDKLREDDAY